MSEMKTDFSTLPLDVMQYIVRLRKEAAHYRLQRDGARKEAEELRAQLGK